MFDVSVCGLIGRSHGGRGVHHVQLRRTHQAQQLERRAPFCVGQHRPHNFGAASGQSQTGLCVGDKMPSAGEAWFPVLCFRRVKGRW